MKPGHSFDELAKGLANSTVSRRQALKLAGGALLGGMLASIPGVALAQRIGGNTTCDEFCHSVFSGREAGQCTSDGARGEGPCFACTPGVGPGPNFTPPECPGGEFNTTLCECEAVGGGTCTSETIGQTCNGNETCFCGRGFGGVPACYQQNSIGQTSCCTPFRTCSSDSDCGSGRVCTFTGCCAPACGNIFPEQNTTPVC